MGTESSHHKLPGDFLHLKDVLNLAIDSFLRKDADTCKTALADLCVLSGKMHGTIHERAIRKA